MDEELVWTDAELDEMARLPPEILGRYRLVARDKVQEWDAQLLELKKIRNDNPAGFINDLMKLEMLYQKQLSEGHRRDRRVKDLEAEVSRLMTENERLRREGPEEKTAAGENEQRVLDLLDRLRQENQEQRGVGA